LRDEIAAGARGGGMADRDREEACGNERAVAAISVHERQRAPSP